MPSLLMAPTHPLGQNFMVVATQNPIEHQGVYPLPEAQLDRFLFKHRVSYPAPEEEKAIIIHHGGGTASHDIKQYGIHRPRPIARRWKRHWRTVGEVTLVRRCRRLYRKAGAGHAPQP